MLASGMNPLTPLFQLAVVVGEDIDGQRMNPSSHQLLLGKSDRSRSYPDPRETRRAGMRRSLSQDYFFLGGGGGGG